MALSEPLADDGAYFTASAEQVARQRAFARARRNSRVVRVLRVLLPIGGALFVVAFIVKAELGLPDGLDLTSASLSVTRNSIIMEQPHLTGFDDERGAYSLSADRAIQPLNAPGEVRLERIKASVASEGQGASRIVAEAGDYDHEKGTLQLLGAVSIESADGYRLRMTDVHVDFRGGSMSTENRVDILYADSEVTGDRLSVTDRGRLIVIEGGVHTMLMPPKRPAGAEPSAGAD